MSHPGDLEDASRLFDHQWKRWVDTQLPHHLTKAAQFAVIETNLRLREKEGE